jgi:hypothetical protein
MAEEIDRRLEPGLFVVTGGSSETSKEPPWIYAAATSVAPFQLTGREAPGDVRRADDESQLTGG